MPVREPDPTQFPALTPHHLFPPLEQAPEDQEPLNREIIREVGGGGGGWTLIEEQTLNANATSVTFSSIPGAYSDLMLRIYGRTDAIEGETGVVADGLAIQMGNGSVDTGNNYSTAGAREGDTAANMERNRIASISSNAGGLFIGVSGDADGQGFVRVLFADYAETGHYRFVEYFGGRDATSTNMAHDHGTGIWRNDTDVVDIITLTTGLQGAGNQEWVSGSIFRLYGRLFG